MSPSLPRNQHEARFGGWKLSGFGRELGPEGLHTYLETIPACASDPCPAEP